MTFVRLLGWAGIITIFGLSGCLIGYDPDSVALVGGGSDPRVVVTSPGPQDEVGNILQIRMDVSNFALVDPEGRENADGEGHVHVYIDGTPIVPGDPPITQTAIDVRVCSLAGDRPIEYNLEVVPSNNDGTPHGTLGRVSISWVKLPNNPDEPCR